MSEQLYTVQEVADRLRLSYVTIWRWIKSGHLGAVRVGSQWRIREDDIDAIMMEAHK